MTTKREYLKSKGITVGARGRFSGAAKQALAEAERALSALVGAGEPLELLTDVARSDDLAAAQAVAESLSKNTSAIFVLGIGGSSLGGQTLAQLAGHAIPALGALRTPRLHFLDNLDPESFGAALNQLPLKTTRFVAISKSGGTGETLMQTIAAISEVKAAGLDPHERFFGISEPAKPGKANGLRTLLESIDVPLLDHDPGVGGRFSVLTNVGILPAAVCGLDIPAIRGGAGDVLALEEARIRGVGAEDVGGLDLLAHAVTQRVQLQREHCGDEQQGQCTDDQVQLQPQAHRPAVRPAALRREDPLPQPARRGHA